MGRFHRTLHDLLTARGPQEATRGPQGTTQGPQGRHKRPQGHHKEPQGDHKGRQRTAKVSPRCPKGSQGTPKGVPRDPQNLSKVPPSKKHSSLKKEFAKVRLGTDEFRNFVEFVGPPKFGGPPFGAKSYRYSEML